jgi:two-component system LytT family response regulator
VTAALRVAIADDEPLARRRLRGLLERDPEVAVVAECRNGPETVDAVTTRRPELLFLDVVMPGRDGLGVLEHLAPAQRPHTVLVTAHDRFALRAFDLHAVDYLLKPYDDDRFAIALARAKTAARQRSASAVEHLVIRGPRATALVAIDAIDWIEAADNYVEVHAGTACHLLRTTLTDLEARLAASPLVRVHRRAIVNVRKVRELRPTPHGDLRLVLDGGVAIPLGRRYRSAVEQRLGLTR